MQREGGLPGPGAGSNKRKASLKNDDGDGDDEELRLARAVAEIHESERSKNRVASIFGESQMPGAARRPECNYGERWEVEEALATVPGHMVGALYKLNPVRTHS
jgi:hypothetical protein